MRCGARSGCPASRGAPAHCGRRGGLIHDPQLIRVRSAVATSHRLDAMRAPTTCRGTRVVRTPALRSDDLHRLLRRVRSDDLLRLRSRVLRCPAVVPVVLRVRDWPLRCPAVVLVVPRVRDLRAGDLLREAFRSRIRLLRESSWCCEAVLLVLGRSPDARAGDLFRDLLRDRVCVPRRSASSRRRVPGECACASCSSTCTGFAYVCRSPCRVGSPRRACDAPCSSCVSVPVAGGCGCDEDAALDGAEGGRCGVGRTAVEVAAVASAKCWSLCALHCRLRSLLPPRFLRGFSMSRT